MHATSTPTSRAQQSLTSVNTVELASILDSKLTKVNLHPSRAVLSRAFLVTVTAGNNRIVISGLPLAVVKDSVKVTGKGAAIIHDIVLSVDPPSNRTGPTTPQLKELLRKRTRVKKAIARCEESLLAYKAYLGTLDVKHTDVESVTKYTEAYEVAAAQLDNKILDLEDQLGLVEGEISDEELKAESDPSSDMLRTRVKIDLIAASDSQIEILLSYAVNDCLWAPSYDVHLNMQSDEKVVKVTYKACISQNTGESWDNVPITLETVDPTFGADIPSLSPWTVSWEKRILPFLTRQSTVSRSAGRTSSAPGVAPKEKDVSDDEGEDTILQSSSAIVKGVISAEFQPPGTITIPSDNAEHHIVVSELTFGATMSWVSVPKANSKAYLKAKVTNTSEYPLLEGNANVFIDDSFTAVAKMPFASPDEAFDLALGVDPSIRITYHPRSTKTTITGYYYRGTTTYACEQRITVLNTKLVPVELKVIDQIPISEETHLKIKLLVPALTIPNLAIAVAKRTKSPPQTVNVAGGVVAQWEYSGNQAPDPEELGKDGKISWTCSLAPQAKAHLVVRWEMASSEGRVFYF